MDHTETLLAQKLLDLFHNFPRQPRYPSPVPGLKPSELVMLFHIRQAVLTRPAGVKISDISKSLLVTSPTVTQHVNRLDKLGLVAKSHDAADRRAVRIRLTPAGDQVLAVAAADFLSHAVGLVQYLGEKQTRRLIDLLTHVAAYCGDRRDPAAHNSPVSD